MNMEFQGEVAYPMNASRNDVSNCVQEIVMKPSIRFGAGVVPTLNGGASPIVDAAWISKRNSRVVVNLLLG